MRVRDVMSSPVVTVPPGMPLKEAAKVLVTHGISAVPVVDDGDLVGILSEADLVPLELAPDREPISPDFPTRHRRPHGSRPRRWPATWRRCWRPNSVRQAPTG